jgi:predicted NBD/HSP70 family sugar kinase
VDLKAPPAFSEQRRICFCGRFNCVETWLAGPSLERSYSIETGLQISAIEIIKKVRQSDPAALKVFEHFAHMLALALANVINILDPAAIVLGGGLSNISELYKALPELLPRYIFSDILNTRILQAIHGDSSGVRGAAWLWHPNEVDKLLGSNSQD